MKNRFQALILTSLIALTSCDANKTIHLYKNNQKVIDGDLTIRFEMSSQSQLLSSGQLYFYIYFLSTNPKPVSLKTNAKKVKIYRESNGAEYKVNTDSLAPYDRIDLQCDIEKSIFLYADLPTLVSADNYYLNFYYKSNKLVIHFYDGSNN